MVVNYYRLWFGNGASLLIYTNIISSLPNLTKKYSSKMKVLHFFWSGNRFINIRFIIWNCLLQEGVELSIISSKQLTQSSLQDSVTSNNYIPLRFNQAGLCQSFWTTAILVVPSYVSNLGLLPKVNLPVNLESFTFLYWIGYFALILLFSSFYSTIVLNPKIFLINYRKWLWRYLSSTWYTDNILLKTSNETNNTSRATMLATLATVPNFIESTLSITSLNGLSTTSLLILAGVVLDLVREVKNIYYSNVYNNMYQ
jgi:preprotein translocase subunit SecY